jgi:hypothetical protein
MRASSLLLLLLLMLLTLLMLLLLLILLMFSQTCGQRSIQIRIRRLMIGGEGFLP